MTVCCLLWSFSNRCGRHSALACCSQSEFAAYCSNLPRNLVACECSGPKAGSGSCECLPFRSRRQALAGKRQLSTLGAACTCVCCIHVHYVLHSSVLAWVSPTRHNCIIMYVTVTECWCLCSLARALKRGRFHAMQQCIAINTSADESEPVTATHPTTRLSHFFRENPAEKRSNIMSQSKQQLQQHNCIERYCLARAVSP